MGTTDAFHLDHYAGRGRDQVYWPNPEAKVVPLPQPRRATEGREKARAVAKALRVERDRVTQTEKAREPTVVTSRPTGAAAGPLARPADPETSHEAAAKQTRSKRAVNQIEVQGILRSRGPINHLELIQIARTLGSKQSDSGLRTRCNELVHAGLARWTGEWRKSTVTGNRMRLWEALPGEVPPEGCPQLPAEAVNDEGEEAEDRLVALTSGELRDFE